MDVDILSYAFNIRPLGHEQYKEQQSHDENVISMHHEQIQFSLTDTVYSSYYNGH